MKQEMIHNDPLDMQPYAMILGTHRQPNKRVDKLLHTDEAQHMIIISNNNVSIIITIKRCLTESGLCYSSSNLSLSMKMVF